MEIKFFFSFIFLYTEPSFVTFFPFVSYYGENEEAVKNAVKSSGDDMSPGDTCLLSYIDEKTEAYTKISPNWKDDGSINDKDKKYRRYLIVNIPKIELEN